MSFPAILPPSKNRQFSTSQTGHFYFANTGHYHFAVTYTACSRFETLVLKDLKPFPD
jgi:hypothetical protein